MSNSTLQLLFHTYRESFRRSLTCSPIQPISRFSTSKLSRPWFSTSFDSCSTIIWKSCSRCIRQLTGILNQKLNVLSLLFAKQFHAIAAQRVRRAAQIMILYNNLGYDRKLIKNVVEKIAYSFLKKTSGRPFSLLLGAAFFSWEKEKISEDELAKIAEEISYIHCERDVNSASDDHLDTWEKVIDKGPVKLWRKPVPNSYLYEYKVYGSYHDIPARAFFFIQVDLEFRKQWDKLVISLDVIDKEEESGSEVVHWVTHFPYPMYSRDYVYIRKYKVDYERMLMIIVNRSIEHPSQPTSDKHVRVNTYMSKMVIKPHTSFDENGFDYVLTYYDDPKATFPKFAYNWMANTGVPDFVDKLHQAAIMLQERRKGLHKEDQTDPNRGTLPM